MADLWMGMLLLAGGTVGTAYAVSQGRTRRQRRFLSRVCALVWFEVAVFIVAVLKTPRPYSFLICLPYALIVPLTAARARSLWQQLLDSEKPVDPG